MGHFSTILKKTQGGGYRLHDSLVLKEKVMAKSTKQGLYQSIAEFFLFPTLSCSLWMFARNQLPVLNSKFELMDNMVGRVSERNRSSYMRNDRWCIQYGLI